MQRVSFFVFFSLLSLCGMTQANGGNVFTLKQCIETGIRNNLDVQQAELQMQVSKVNWNQARLNMLPNLNGNIGHGINQGRSIDPFTNAYINEQVSVANYGLNSGVILFYGLALQRTNKQTSLAYQASRFDWQQAKDNLTINIILAYLSALSFSDQLVQAQNQLDLSGKQVERLNTLNQEGSIRPSDLSDIKGQYANDQLTLISMRNSLETAKISLCQLMNITYNQDMQLERLDAQAMLEQYPTGPDEIYKTALTQFALVRAAELRTQSARWGVKATRGTLFPRLTLNGGANSNYSSVATQNTYINTTERTTGNYVLVNGNQSFVIQKQDNFQSSKISYSRQLNNNIYTSVSLNLSIPLFNALQTRNRLRLDKIEAKRVDLVEKNTKTQLQQDVEGAHVNMASAFDRYRTLLEQVNAYTESFKAAEIRFNEGVGTSIDYLIAKNNMDRANNNFIIAKYDYVLRTRILDYYQGRPLW